MNPDEARRGQRVLVDSADIAGTPCAGWVVDVGRVMFRVSVRGEQYTVRHDEVTLIPRPGSHECGYSPDTRRWECSCGDYFWTVDGGYEHARRTGGVLTDAGGVLEERAR